MAESALGWLCRPAEVGPPFPIAPALAPFPVTVFLQPHEAALRGTVRKHGRPHLRSQLAACPCSARALGPRPQLSTQGSVSSGEGGSQPGRGCVESWAQWGPLLCLCVRTPASHCPADGPQAGRLLACLWTAADPGRCEGLKAVAAARPSGPSPTQGDAGRAVPPGCPLSGSEACLHTVLSPHACAAPSGNANEDRRGAFLSAHLRGWCGTHRLRADCTLKAQDLGESSLKQKKETWTNLRDTSGTLGSSRSVIVQGCAGLLVSQTGGHSVALPDGAGLQRAEQQGPGSPHTRLGLTQPGQERDCRVLRAGGGPELFIFLQWVTFVP